MVRLALVPWAVVRLKLSGVNGQYADGMPGHAFISYVREDRERADRLQVILERAGIRVWRDTADLWPGQDWKIEIRRAIMARSLAFIACFSENTERRVTSYQNEELILAVEQMRVRAPGQAWLIPVRFADCTTPPFDLGAGRRLDSLQRIDLFDGSWEFGIPRLVGALLRILQAHSGPAGTPKASIAGSPSVPAEPVAPISFGDRLAGLKAQEQEAQDAGQREADRGVSQRRADWAKIFNAAQWAAAEYARSGVEPSPIMWEWSEIKPGTQRRIRQKDKSRNSIVMSVPEYVHKRGEIAKGYPVWADRLVITTFGQGVWVKGGYLAEPPETHVPKVNGPPTPEILARYSITQWHEGETDKVIDEILLAVANRVGES